MWQTKYSKLHFFSQKWYRYRPRWRTVWRFWLFWSLTIAISWPWRQFETLKNTKKFFICEDLVTSFAKKGEIWYTSFKTFFSVIVYHVSNLAITILKTVKNAKMFFFWEDAGSTFVQKIEVWRSSFVTFFAVLLFSNFEYGHCDTWKQSKLRKCFHLGDYRNSFHKQFEFCHTVTPPECKLQ